MSTRHQIALVPGDGIGLEVVPAAVRVLDAVAEAYDFHLSWTELDWGSDYYHRHGRMMPVDGLDQLGTHDAIFLGAVGTPDIPDVETLWGLLIPIRRAFMQYVNLRPVRTMPHVRSPLADDRALDLVVVRENVEGEYSEVGGRLYRGRPEEMAVQESIFTRAGVSRVAEFAFDLAEQRGGRVISATKSNGIVYTMPFWDEVVAAVAERHPGVRCRSVLIDALAAEFVLRPQEVDVVVASNLFGDILSDLAGAIAGSIGVAPSANLNPPREYPSMFEPVHGSAPDIAGQGIANPVGQIWSGAMMLDHLGHADAATALEAAFRAAMADGVLTRDLGGQASTAEFADATIARLNQAKEN
ncbi:MAG TPA: tartrate dehydrogenase [Candidatus Ruania gallistercoris]|uniref:D-malate dehydrogenase (decarboxylating) n=1 Tax=Candidatus Ruania gallistercoris TaxID=2838746 RepID=A0A9D2EDF3_9MICO|nr:tartrate dehydrogenase [Candidatus Ruania gallistercoris]